VAFIYKNRDPKLLTIELPPAQEYRDFVVENTTSTEEVSLEPEETVVEDEEIIENEEAVVEPEVPLVEDEPEEKSVVKAGTNLKVPFISQAPSKNWEQPFQDACEEASVLMVDYYYNGKQVPGVAEQEDILSAMVKWQEDNWGGHHNLPADKVAELIYATFNYRVEVVEDLTAVKLKYYLDQGQPVIIPADGRKLANPYFKNGGPAYHMLVVKGYVDDKFITNDPGTMHGADFVYSEENLFYSIHDWNTEKDQAIGPSVGLILYPN